MQPPLHQPSDGQLSADQQRPPPVGQAHDPECGGPEAARAPDVPLPRGDAATKGVALDIETTGLEPDCALTCVCTWDGHIGRTWFFRSDDEAERSRTEIVRIFDEAPLLFAFNGAHFDLPVLARCLGCAEGPWMAKLVDPLYAARGLLGRDMSQDLNSFLELNGLPTKSGTGAHAVELARAGEWDALGSYCMDDTRLTFDAIAARGLWNADPRVRFDPWHSKQMFIRESGRTGQPNPLAMTEVRPQSTAQ